MDLTFLIMSYAIVGAAGWWLHALWHGRQVAEGISQTKDAGRKIAERNRNLDDDELNAKLRRHAKDSL